MGGGGGAGPSGSNDRWLSLTEQPFNGLTIGAMTEFSSELKDPSCTKSRHPNTTATAIHFGVTIFRSQRNGFPELGLGSRLAGE